MAGKPEIFKVDKPDRLKVMWLTMHKRLKDFGLPLSIKEPDFAKLEAEMKKGKPAEFTIAFTKGKFTAQVAAGSLTLPITSLDVFGAKNARELVLKVNAISDFVSKEELARFPDPAVVEALKADIERLKFSVQRDLGFLKTWPKNFASMDRGLAEVGFTHWAEGHRYDAYVTFLLWQEWGRSPASLAEQFFKPNAKQPVKVTDAARKAILDPLAQGEKPKFEQAVKEVTKIVDTILIPMYRKEDGKAIEKRIAEEQAELAKKVGELKKLQAP